MFCTNCGNSIESIMKFCPKCGAIVSTPTGNNTVNSSIVVNDSTPVETRHSNPVETSNSTSIGTPVISSEKKKNPLVSVGSWIASVVIIIFLIMSFTGKFNKLAHDLTNGAYAYNDESEVKTESGGKELNQSGYLASGISSDYEKLRGQMDPQKAIDFFTNDWAYDTAYLTRHEMVYPENGRPGDSGTTDGIYAIVTCKLPKSGIFSVREVGAVFSYWNEAIGWANSYGQIISYETDFSALEGSCWRLSQEVVENVEKGLAFDPLQGMYDNKGDLSSLTIQFHDVDKIAYRLDGKYDSDEYPVVTVSVLVDGEWISDEFWIEYKSAELVRGAEEPWDFFFRLKNDKTGYKFVLSGFDRIDSNDIDALSSNKTNNAASSAVETTGENTLPNMLYQIIVDAPDGYVNVREEPSTSSAVLYEVTNGGTFNVIAEHGDWLEIILFNEDGYYSAYVHKSQIIRLNKSPYDNYVIWGSDSGFFDESILAGLTAWDCRIARNEIYARHGKIFKEPELDAYFYCYEWYEPVSENISDADLNQWELANVKMISQYEKKMGYTK